MDAERVSFAGAYRGKRVLVTGHTGFKGAWLCEWLCNLGAKVTGLALEPETTPALFSQLRLGDRIEHIIEDVRNRGRVAEIIHRVRPDFLFHLAAQPLVRLSYETPVETYDVNVMGTVHVLDALRPNPSTLQPFNLSTVFITTDKCYENREWLHAYREEDPLGGYDPYSSSKAAAEIAIAAYRRSFFNPSTNPPVKIASARAGNVIGGGDWALDRIIPDAMRALGRGQVIPVRNKHATRPWQHVLEPLGGYLWLGALLSQRETIELSSAFNFGPSLDSNRSVGALIEEVLKHRKGAWEDKSNADAVHEAGLLNLSTDKAHHLLKWRPVWNFEETIRETVRWYSEVEAGADPHALARAQIESYTSHACELGIEWASCPLASH